MNRSFFREIIEKKLWYISFEWVILKKTSRSNRLLAWLRGRSLEIFKNLREIGGRIERRRVRTPKCCPKCASSKLSLSSTFDVWLTPEQYVCENCGYKGPIVMELCDE
jgi:hypothetical protein